MTSKLVAVLLVLAAVAYLFWPTGTDLRHDFPSDVQLCKANMTEINRGLREYTRRLGHPPNGSGAAFLAELIEKGIWEASAENRARLTCPGQNAQPVPEGTDYTKLDTLDGTSTAYAARDQERFPLKKFPDGGVLKEPILACDNANGMNHDGAMNVLFADGSIETWTVELEHERKRIPADVQVIVVGPESLIETLRKLKVD